MEKNETTVSSIMDRIRKSVRRIQRINHYAGNTHTELAKDVHKFITELKEFHDFDIMYVIAKGDMTVKIVLEFEHLMTDTSYTLKQALDDPYYHNLIAQCEKWSNQAHEKAFARAMKGV